MMTEFLMFGTSKQLSIVSVSSIRVGDFDVIHAAKNLVFLVRYAHEYGKTCGSTFFYLYISDTYENTLQTNVLRN